MHDIGFAWLEITGKCQLQCEHCYPSSGPDGTHGTMSQENWASVIDQLAGRGVGMVQFIGGEPTLHPDLPALTGHALDRGLRVEIFLQPRPCLLCGVGGTGAARRFRRDQLLLR